MPPIVIVDSGPLFAASHVRDQHHARCADLLSRTDLDFVIPALCIAETSQLLSARSGWRSEHVFIDSLAGLDVRLPEAEDWHVIARLLERYSDFDIGAADASVVTLAETLGAETIATIDHRHFRAIRPRHVEAFMLLPEM